MLKLILICFTGNFPAVYMQADMVVFREFLMHMSAATAIVVDESVAGRGHGGC